MIDLDVIKGTDPISRCMSCVHDYIEQPDGKTARCPKCEIEVTVTALLRDGIPFRKP